MTNSHSPTLNPINTNQATEVIETLMNLAQQGEIDPWDVQVIDVIDRFLNELGINEYGDNIYEQATLPRSGQAFLWASMLVRFKADSLEQLERDDSEQEFPCDPEEMTEEGQTVPYFRPRKTSPSSNCCPTPSSASCYPARVDHSYRRNCPRNRNSHPLSSS